MMRYHLYFLIFTVATYFCLAQNSQILFNTTEMKIVSSLRRSAFKVNNTCSSNKDCGGSSRGICGGNQSCKCLSPASGAKCVSCRENRYDENCTYYCDEVVNCSGHGRCNWYGRPCICFSGWSGPTCTNTTEFLQTSMHEPSTSTSTIPLSSATAGTYTAVVPGLETLGAVQILLPTLTLGIPSTTSDTTFRLPGRFSQIQITIPAGSWVTTQRRQRRSSGSPLTVTVFMIPNSSSSGSPSFPGTACGPAVDLGPHGKALAAPIFVSVPCALPYPAAVAAAYSLSGDIWSATPVPASGSAYVNGTVWGAPPALTAIAPFWVSPSASAAAPAGPIAAVVIGSAVGAAACCLASFAVGWIIFARRGNRVHGGPYFPRRKADNTTEEPVPDSSTHICAPDIREDGNGGEGTPIPHSRSPGRTDNVGQRPH